MVQLPYFETYGFSENNSNRFKIDHRSYLMQDIKAEHFGNLNA